MPQLAKLLVNGPADDVFELGRECAEELFPQLRGRQLQKPGVRSEASCLQERREHGVAVRRSEPLGRRLERLYEGTGRDVGGGDCIADHCSEVVEVGTAGGQVVDGARDGSHRQPIDPRDISVR